MNFNEQGKKIQDELQRNRRHFHKNPETGFDVENTVNYIKECLKDTNSTMKDIPGNGLLVELGPDTGRTMLLRVDIDAVSIPEETDEEFKSVNNYMHACGHDMHTTIGIGVTKILSEYADSLQGRVKVMFQPAEELLIGGETMVNAGVLENPKVDACIAPHVMNYEEAPTGSFLFPGSGPVMASSDFFEITVKGKGGHGAQPFLSIDPISPIANINSSLNTIIAKEVPSDEIAVLSACITKGGSISNVIPDEATLGGTFRTFNGEVRDLIKKRIEEMSINIAKAYRCEATVEYSSGCPNVLVDKDLLKEIVSYCEEISEFPVIDVEVVSGKPLRITGADDFSHYAVRVPSVYFAVIATNKNGGEVYPLHHAKVTFDDSILGSSSATLAHAIMRFLEEK